MLLAEDLLLLLTNDDTGKLAKSGTKVDVALGGAVLVDLTLMGRVDVADPGETVREGRLVVRDSTPTGDAVLDEALATIGEKEGKKPKSVVARLGKGVRATLYGRLVEDGVLRAEKGRVLGIFPTDRWPAENANHEASVRAGIASALRDGRTSDPRTGALISLLLALRAVHKVMAPSSVGVSEPEMKASAKRIAQGDWAAKAVRQAIDSTNAAIIAASSSAASAGGGGGS
jgi:Golgi phosphoprotein 3 (GPP34).